MTATAKRDDLVSVGCMCGALLSVPTGLKGKRIKCMRCGSMATIPMTAQPTRQNSFSKEPKTVPPVVPPSLGASRNRVAWVVICSLAATWAVFAIGSALSDNTSYAPVSSQSAFSAASVPASQTNEPADEDYDKLWLDMERTRINSMESDIGSTDRTLELQKLELESMSSRLRYMAVDADENSAYEYENLRSRYNREVDGYNMARRRMASSYSTYESSLNNFNARVNSYNVIR